ncbi:plasmid stability protein [Pseudochelatococcus lubricantis]|uniref:Plasmid stability protein n=1 Tax=Pseudochelatococcus lubricantis TaxID=1538102 RepID=A0ABX0UWA3_9HYPH|nr:Arc family DNA-binding protein [Pseudochelatococcus lubricantis]NIJ57242.1 plasmid stability protein [Pseudochelatococcus lubricantis]
MAKDPYPSETADRYIVRFPDGMRDRLKAEAAKNNRSLNAEIVARLEASFDATAKPADSVNGAHLRRMEAAARRMETAARLIATQKRLTAVKRAIHLGKRQTPPEKPED